MVDQAPEDPIPGEEYALTTTSGRLVPHLGVKRGDVSSPVISHRWYYVLALHLAGKTQEEIGEEVGYTPATVSRILNDKQMVRLRQQLLEDSWKEFEALQNKVIGVIRDKLASQDEGVQLAAVNIWLKAAQKYGQKLTGVNVTAEDVVLNIMQGDVHQGPQEKKDD